MNAILEKPTEIADAPLMTADEFLLSPYERAELVEGKVIEMAPVGFEHGDSAIDLAVPLREWARSNKAGAVVTEVGFLLKRDPDMVRAPDIAFIEKARVPSGRDRRKFIDGAPNLAVEILSPGNTWSEIERKVNEYLEAGAGAVWIVDSDEQTLTVRTADFAPRVWRAHETLEGGAVLPGFSWDLKELFEND